MHSVHAYFLSAGHLDSEIRFEVSTIRDGKSFSVRRVTVFQGQRTIMILAASFHIQEEGFEHQIDVAKDITQPEDLMNWNDLLIKYESVLSQEAKFFLKMPRPIEFRPMFYDIPGNGESLPPINHVWFKLKNDFKSSSLALKQQVLTYISDYNILITAMHPHTDTNPGVISCRQVLITLYGSLGILILMTGCCSLLIPHHLKMQEDFQGGIFSQKMVY